MGIREVDVFSTLLADKCNENMHRNAHHLVHLVAFHFEVKAPADVNDRQINFDIIIF